MAQDLIDEYWLFRLQLDLIESRTFPRAVAHLRYRSTH